MTYPLILQGTLGPLYLLWCIKYSYIESDLFLWNGPT